MDHLWPQRHEVDLTKIIRRARLLMAQAAASMLIHELGVALSRHAASDDTGELDELMAQIAIGQVRRLAGNATD